MLIHANISTKVALHLNCWCQPSMVRLHILSLNSETQGVYFFYFFILIATGVLTGLLEEKKHYWASFSTLQIMTYFLYEVS